MNPVVRAQLTEFREKYKEITLSETDFFEVMSIFAVENGLLSENVDPFDIHLAGTEFGIDGIGILIQGNVCKDTDEAINELSRGKNHHCEFHFFQTKTSVNLDYGDVAKFLDGVHDFFTNAQLVQSAQVDDLRSAKDKVYSTPSRINPILKCFYTTAGPGAASNIIQSLADTNKNRLEALSIFSHVEILFLGATEIQSGYRSASNSTSATIEFPKNVTLPAHESVEEGYVGFVSANQIMQIASSPPDSSGNKTVR